MISLVLIPHGVETWCRVEMSCIARARARPRLFWYRGWSVRVTFFVTISPHNPHTQCNAMQTRFAGHLPLNRRNPPVYAGIEQPSRWQGLVVLNRGSAAYYFNCNLSNPVNHIFSHGTGVLLRS